MPLLPRSRRVRAIIITGLRREFRRPAAIVVTGMRAALVTISSIVTVLFAQILFPGSTSELSFFAIWAANGAMVVLVTLMAAILGSVSIADHLKWIAFKLYFTPPIRH